MKKCLTLLLVFIALIGTSQNYIKDIGINDINDGATAIQAYSGNLIVAGYVARSFYISEINPETGEQVWIKSFDYSNYADVIADIKLTPDNQLAICGYGRETKNNYQFLEFFIKFNLQTQKITWAKNITKSVKPSTILFDDNGDWLVLGDDYEKGNFGMAFLRISNSNGKLKDFNSYYLSSRESASAALIKNNKIYTAGRVGLTKNQSKFRGAIACLDKNFKLQWGNYYLTPKKNYARNYIIDLIEDKDSLVALWYTNNYGINNEYNISLTKTDVNGNLGSAIELSLPNYESVTVRNIIAHNGFYYIIGYTKPAFLENTEKILLIKLTQQGKAVFTKTIGTNFNTKLAIDDGTYFTILNEQLYIVGKSNSHTPNRDFNSVLWAVNLNGEIDSTCQLTNEPLEINPYINPIKEPIFLTEYDTTLTSNNLALEDMPYQLENDRFLCNPIAPDTDFKNAAPNNLILLLDISLSMQQKDRLPLFKKVFETVLYKMRSIDKVSVVTYAGQAELVLNGEKATKQTQILSKIDELKSSGVSDIYAGMKMALNVLKSNYYENGNNRIIVVTDGSISLKLRESLGNLLNKQLDNDNSVSVFLFNESTVINQQFAELLLPYNGDIYKINENNAVQFLIKELTAIKK